MDVPISAAESRKKERTWKMRVEISLDLYRIFCAVVRTGNMSAAAKELFITQPAVSMAVRQLEEKMGGALLVRTTKGVYPTAEGKLLYTYLEQALGLIHTAEEKYFQMVHMEAGELKIGASDTIIAHYLLPYLEQYHKRYPEINIKVTNKTTQESLRLLRNGSVDVCFVNLPLADSTDLEVTECMEIQDILVGGERYHLLAQVGLDIRDLPKYPLLMLEEMSNTRRLTDCYAEENGVVLTPILELGSNDLLISFAKINLGLTFVIREFTEQELRQRTLYEIPLYPPMPKRQIGRVRLKQVEAPHAVRGLITLMEEGFPK